MANPILRQKLAAKDFFVAPGLQDMIAAAICNKVGFEIVYGTGYWTTASASGLPDAGIATYTQMLDRMATLARTSTAALIADADTGYGGLLNVHHTVKGYEAAGITAIQLEDQEFPKKCGHTPFKRVIPLEDMVEKIKVAAEARIDKQNFLIVARTDARYAHGLDEALRRGEAFLEAGADVLFIESPESIEELRKIGETFKGTHLLANMVEGGRTPYLDTTELASLGFTVALFPATGFLSAAAALKAAYTQIQTTGIGTGGPQPMLPFAEMNTLMGFAAVHDFERRHGRTDERA